jgi:hypothetical protein
MFPWKMRRGSWNHSEARGPGIPGQDLIPGDREKTVIHSLNELPDARLFPSAHGEAEGREWVLPG